MLEREATASAEAAAAAGYRACTLRKGERWSYALAVCSREAFEAEGWSVVRTFEPRAAVGAAA